jgi:xylan 1,4-beta-xylosidase
MRNLFLIAIALTTSLMTAAQTEKYYTNPILAGFYPDPSICRAGDDYYIVNSSFAYYPGLPLFHSKDLVSWKQIGHALDRPEQLDLMGAGVSRGLFAPAISYHKGIFYIVCTLIDKGGNFVITATDPKGPWSNPVWLKEVDGIDPSLYFDDNDKAYIVYNSIPPDNKSLWNGHRTIRMRAFDYKSLKVSADEKLIVNGGADISKKPVWIEAPHIYKVNGWYYLMCAEGGTAYNHSEVVFRSKQAEGPYTPYEHNPILTQRHLDAKRKNPVTTAGHADLVETKDGKWYAVYLACRPYEGNHFNTGRETFMSPVSWKDGWPVIHGGEETIQYRYPLPLPQVKSNPVNPFSGNLVYRDEFNGKRLDHRWIFLRTVTQSWFALNKKGFLSVQLRPETIAGKGNPSFVAHRQQHLKFSAATAVAFDAGSDNEKAGITVFQNEDHFYYLCRSVADGKPVVQLYKSVLLPADSTKMDLVAQQELSIKKSAPLYFKIEGRGNYYQFFYSTDAFRWTAMNEGMDARFLSTETAGGFVGCTIGLYATSLGKQSSKKAMYEWFEYRGDDEVFK